jgi:predicted kinase
MSVPPDMLLSEVAERRDLDHALLMRLADRISALHAAAEIVPGGGAGAIRAALPLQRAELAAHREHLDERAAAGRFRRGHGALRLDHIALTETGPEPFGSQDTGIDILFDLANLLEDLWCRGLGQAANVIVNRYVDVLPQGARGWALLPLFLSIRANDVDQLADSPPRLLAIGGLSGTGKSTLARALGGLMGRAPGARVLRSDVFRKRIMGLPPEARLPPSHYTAQSDAETWETLFESADDHLSCGTSVIIDAVFMRRSERDVVAMLADRARVPFTGLWLEAPERDRIARVNARSGDASDAGAEVVREQSRRSVGELYGWHRMRVNRPAETVIAAARAVIDRTRR